MINEAGKSNLQIIENQKKDGQLDGQIKKEEQEMFSKCFRTNILLLVGLAPNGT